MSGMAQVTSDSILEVIRKESWILDHFEIFVTIACLLYTSPSPRDRQKSRMPSSAWKQKNNKIKNHFHLCLLYTSDAADE